MAELKTVIVGDADVGKTSLSARFVHGAIPETASPTIGASFLQKRCITGEDEEVILQIWDTAGQERFRAMAPMYYRHAKIAVVVFDITKAPPTVENLENWRRMVVSYASQNVVIAVAGGKSDLDHHEELDLDALRAACTSVGLQFFKTSAVTGEGVDDLFTWAIQAAMKERRERNSSDGGGEGATLAGGLGGRGSVASDSSTVVLGDRIGPPGDKPGGSGKNKSTKGAASTCC